MYLARSPVFHTLPFPLNTLTRKDFMIAVINLSTKLQVSYPLVLSPMEVLGSVVPTLCLNCAGYV